MTTSPDRLSKLEFLQVAGVYLAEYRSRLLLNLGFLLSLALATSTLLSILVLNHASKQQYQQAQTKLTPPIAFSIEAKDGSTIKDSDYVRLIQLGFSQLRAAHRFSLTLTSGKTFQIQALDILPLVLAQPESFSSQALNLSHTYAEKLGLAKESGLPQQIELSTGQTIALKVHDSANTGYANHADAVFADTALMDIGLLRAIFPTRQGLTHLYSPPLPDWEKGRLIDALPAHLVLSDTWSLEERSGFADALHLNLSALAILGFIVTLFIAYQAANQAWSNRAKLALKLRLLGVNLNTLRWVMLFEALVLNLIATAFGIMLAQGLVSLLLPILGLTLEQIYNLKVSGHFQWLWQYSALAFTITSFAVFIALWRQFKLIGSTRIAFSARNSSSTYNHRRSLIIALGLFGVFAVWPSGTWHHLMLKYGLLLLASVALLPAITRLALRGLAWLTGSFFLTYIIQDASHQVGRRYLPLAAFYLALTTSSSAALMVASFESSFTGFLDQILQADFYIRYRHEQTERIDTWLTDNRRKLDYAPFQHTVAKYQRDTLYVSVYTSEQQWASLHLKQGLPARQMPDEGHCYINEQFALKHRLGLQDEITFTQGQASLTCVVAGVYYEYGTQILGLRLTADSALNALSGWRETGYGLYLAPGSSIDRQTLRSELDLSEDQLYQPQEIKRQALAVFEQTFLLTQAIAFVLLAIACFGLFLSVNSLELARKSDLYILSSLGYSRLALFTHMLAQWLLMILAIVALSWPMAIVLANALVGQILPASFGWSMPLVLDVEAFALTSAMGLILLVPALALPLYRLNARGRFL